MESASPIGYTIKNTRIQEGFHMKQYECDLCGYVYDEAAGDPDNGIVPAPNGRICPRTGYARCAVREKTNSRKNKGAPKRAAGVPAAFFFLKIGLGRLTGAAQFFKMGTKAKISRKGGVDSEIGRLRRGRSANTARSAAGCPAGLRTAPYDRLSRSMGSGESAGNETELV